MNEFSFYHIVNEKARKTREKNTELVVNKPLQIVYKRTGYDVFTEICSVAISAIAIIGFIAVIIINVYGG